MFCFNFFANEGVFKYNLNVMRLAFVEKTKVKQVGNEVGNLPEKEWKFFIVSCLHLYLFKCNFFEVSCFFGERFVQGNEFVLADEHVKVSRELRFFRESENWFFCLQGLSPVVPERINVSENFNEINAFVKEPVFQGLEELLSYDVYMHIFNIIFLAP